VKGDRRDKALVQEGGGGRLRIYRMLAGETKKVWIARDPMIRRSLIALVNHRCEMILRQTARAVRGEATEGTRDVVVPDVVVMMVSGEGVVLRGGEELLCGGVGGDAERAATAQIAQGGLRGRRHVGGCEGTYAVGWRGHVGFGVVDELKGLNAVAALE